MTLQARERAELAAHLLVTGEQHAEWVVEARHDALGERVGLRGLHARIIARWIDALRDARNPIGGEP
jgi:hypothetical protein